MGIYEICEYMEYVNMGIYEICEYMEYVNIWNM